MQSLGQNYAQYSWSWAEIHSIKYQNLVSMNQYSIPMQNTPSPTPSLWYITLHRNSYSNELIVFLTWQTYNPCFATRSPTLIVMIFFLPSVDNMLVRWYSAIISDAFLVRRDRNGRESSV